MPSIKLIGALSVSLALVGGALWFRFVKVPTYSAPLVTLEEITQFSSDDAYLKDFLGSTTTPRSVSTTTLSKEDLIGRQLFSEYIGLKSKGQVTPDNLLSLADKYAQDIINTEISAKKIVQNQIIVVADSEENMVTYGASITAIRLKYKNAAAARYSNVTITDVSSSAFLSFTTAASKLYQDAANELLLVRTPSSLSLNHLNLINNYLENAEALKLIGDTSKNPVQAYAAINIYTQNYDKELELMQNIQRILMASGIIFNNAI